MLQYPFVCCLRTRQTRWKSLCNIVSRTSKLQPSTYNCVQLTHLRRCSNTTPAQGLNLSGKSAVVTGSTSGIGLGVAKSLARAGASVVLNGFGEPGAIENIQENLTREYGVKAHFVEADLSSLEDITKMCQRVTSLLPAGVDILVNNAGIQHVCDVESFPVEKWDLLLSVMLSAPFHLTRLFLPGMKSKGWGRIINLGSVHSLIASPNKSAYCSAKHGLIGLTRAVALETAGSGVTCNAVCPGFVNTEIFQAQVRTRAETDNVNQSEAKRRILEQVHPTKDTVEISQIADFITFLCSTSTDQMTGSVLTIDAGWTAR